MYWPNKFVKQFFHNYFKKIEFFHTEGLFDYVNVMTQIQQKIMYFLDILIF